MQVAYLLRFPREFGGSAEIDEFRRLGAKDGIEELAALLDMETTTRRIGSVFQ
jgi:hypothetical protein